MVSFYFESRSRRVVRYFTTMFKEYSVFYSLPSSFRRMLTISEPLAAIIFGSLWLIISSAKETSLSKKYIFFAKHYLVKLSLDSI